MRQLPNRPRVMRPLNVVLLVGLLTAASASRAEEQNAPAGQPPALPPGIASALQARAYAFFCNGMELMLSGENAAAADEFQKVVGLDPQAERAWYHLGSLHRSLGDYDKSIECFGKAAELEPTDFRAHFELGRVMMLTGKVDGGIKAWENAAANAEGRTAVYIYDRLAKYFERTGQPRKAIDAMRKAMEVSDSPTQTARSLLSLQERHGDWRGVIETYKALLKLQPQANRLHVNIAQSYERLGEWKKAVDEYDAFFAENPPVLEHYTTVLSAMDAANKAGLKQKLDEYLDVSVKLLNEALSDNGDSGNAVFSLTRMLTRSGHTDIAVNLLNKGMQEAPARTKADIHSALANVYVWQAEPREAEKHLLAAVEIDPENPIFYSNLGDIYRDLFEYSKAAEQYSKAIKYAPETVRRAYHATLAEIYIEQKDYAKAEEQVKAVIAQDPGSGAAWAGYGQVQELAGDPEQAAEGYAKAVELGAPDPMVEARWRVELAELYGSIDKKEKQAAEYDAIKQLAENKAAVLPIVYGLYDLKQYDIALQILAARQDSLSDRVRSITSDLLARLYEKTGNTKEAREIYQKSLADAPEDIRARVAMGGFLARQKEYEKAIELLRKSLNDQKPDDEDMVIQARLTIADVLDSQGNVAEAQAEYEKIAKEYPDDASVNNNVAYYFSVKGIKLETALDMVRKALSVMPGEPAYLDTYGWILYGMGNYEGAVMAIHKAWYRQQDSEVAEHLGDALLKLGRNDLALEYYQQGMDLDPDSNQIAEKIRNLKGKIQQTKAK